MLTRTTCALVSLFFATLTHTKDAQTPFAIMLNGTTSCGKTSISWALANLSSKPMLMTGCDKCWAMIPRSKLADWFEFVPGKDEEGKETAHWIPTPQLGQKLYDAAPKIARLLVDQGFNVIIDEVILDDRALKMYADALEGIPVYFVGVHCSLGALEEREKLRCDRPLGLARRQLPLVHSSTRHYDIQISTEHKEPADCAKEILDFVDNNPHPTGLAQCRQQLATFNTPLEIASPESTHDTPAQTAHELHEGGPIAITPSGKENKPADGSRFPSF